MVPLLCGCAGVMKDRTRIVVGPANVTVGSVSTPWGISLPGWNVNMEEGAIFVGAGKDTDPAKLSKLVKAAKGGAVASPGGAMSPAPAPAPPPTP